MVKKRQKFPPVCRMYFTRPNGTTFTEDSTFHSHCHDELSCYNILPDYMVHIPEDSNFQEISYSCRNHLQVIEHGPFLYRPPCCRLISPACRTEKPDFFGDTELQMNNNISLSGLKMPQINLTLGPDLRSSDDGSC